MSIRPEFADAILTGTKLVEFRKRRLAPDVTTVLIYATMPVGRVVGVFEVDGYDTGSPSAVWERHKAHAGISRRGFRAYYSGTRTAVALLVRDARRLDRPPTLSALDPGLRAPQSFCYLELNPLTHRSAGQHLGQLVTPQVPEPVRRTAPAAV
jgi:predicted transcriptional regulator